MNESIQKKALSDISGLKTALIAPAGKVDIAKLVQGEQSLRGCGLEVFRMPNVLEQNGYLAGFDYQRCADFQEAWLGNDADIIWSVRGGYGSMRFLDELNYELLKGHQKILIGHSDITALHLAFDKHSLFRSVSGIMPSVEFCQDWQDDLTVSSLVSSILNEPFAYHNNSAENCLKSGMAEGRCLPLTLSVLTYMLSSKYLPSFKNTVLILEDINEGPYKIDAFLCQLKMSGILSDINGLVFGDFSNCGSKIELMDIFEEYSRFVNGPVVCGMPFGHCLPRLNLPVSSPVCLNAGEDGYNFKVFSLDQS